MTGSIEKKKLYAFGYGLALIVPFLVLLHGVKTGLGFGAFMLIFAGGLIGLMFVIEKISGWNPVRNIWIFVFQAGIISYKFFNDPGPVSMFLLGLAVALLAITLWSAEKLKPLYDGWMAVAGIIGKLISGLILSLLFYLVFAPVGLVLRVLGKDLLDQRIEPDKSSYWHKREHVFNKENYQRQF